MLWLKLIHVSKWDHRSFFRKTATRATLQCCSRSDTLFAWAVLIHRQCLLPQAKVNIALLLQITLRRDTRSEQALPCDKRGTSRSCFFASLSDSAIYFNSVWLNGAIWPFTEVRGANMGPTWVLSAQMGPMLAPWTLLSGVAFNLLTGKSWAPPGMIFFLFLIIRN